MSGSEYIRLFMPAPNRYSSPMQSFCRKTGTLPSLALSLVLIAAQSVAATHAFEHDTGNTQNPVCTTCVAASQFGAATVDTGATVVLAGPAHVRVEAPASPTQSFHTLTARQRGPPASL